MTSNDYRKPLPIPDEDSQPYFDACKQGELKLQRCSTCKKMRYEPENICPHCLSDQFTWEPLSGKGAVYTFSVVHRAYYPGFKPELPYVIAVIDLEEGPRMVSNIINCKAEKVSIGMPLKVTFKKCTEEITLPYFEPA